MAMNVSEPTVSEQIEKLYKRLEDVYKQQEVYGLYIKQKFELMQSVINQQEMDIGELKGQLRASQAEAGELGAYTQGIVQDLVDQSLEDIDTRLFNLEQYHDICQDSDTD